MKSRKIASVTGNSGQTRRYSTVLVVERGVIRSCQHIFSLQEAKRILARQGPGIANPDNNEPIIRALGFLMLYDFQPAYIPQAGDV